MLKAEFLAELERNLSHLSHHKRDRTLEYHSGIIDGRIQGGMTEEEAVALFGSVEKAALKSIRYEHSSHRISKKIKSMPTALRLILSTAAVIFCMLLIAAVWTILLSVYFMVALVALGGLAVIAAGAIMSFVVSPPVGVCVIGAGIVVEAVSLFLLGPARAMTRFASLFGKYIIGKIRGLLAKEALSV